MSYYRTNASVLMSCHVHCLRNVPRGATNKRKWGHRWSGYKHFLLCGGEEDKVALMPNYEVIKIYAEVYFHILYFESRMYTRFHGPTPLDPERSPQGCKAHGLYGHCGKQKSLNPFRNRKTTLDFPAEILVTMLTELLYQESSLPCTGLHSILRLFTPCVV